MAKVFVVNSAGHNMDKAKEFGELHILTEGKVNIFGTDRLIQEMKVKLAEMTAEDYILLSGSILLNCLVSMIVMGRFKRITLLLYDFGSKSYVKREIEEGLIKESV